ncbi:serine-tRNA synthetase, partial [Pavlovales sp. CCMP2436]
MLDIAHFRVDQGGNPETVRESQRRRFADVDIVDKVIALDEEWRKCRAQLDDARFELNRTQDKMKPFFKEKKPVPAELTAEKLACDEDIALIAGTEQELIEQRDKALGSIGNIVDDSVLVSKDEDENPIVRTHGEFSNEA